ncbi:hypothetical protein ILYODFUR_025307 [Ilyodon furcidens]|uniref:Uncharacterized protein n=1 Tax=Ilyodon furcidens TaxID=33524 RepID=A0ABV0UKV3_9TELE
MEGRLKGGWLYLSGERPVIIIKLGYRAQVSAQENSKHIFQITHGWRISMHTCLYLSLSNLVEWQNISRTQCGQSSGISNNFVKDCNFFIITLKHCGDGCLNC